jgi:ABC-2 type transport system ATP-binding protein
MWQVIGDLAGGGVTVFLTTQYLDEADHLAARIALIEHGTVVAQGSLDELKRLVPGGHVSITFTDPASLDAAARALGDLPRDHETRTLQIPSDGSVASMKALLNRLDDHSIRVDRLAIHTPDLDDVFFALTGHTPIPAGAGTEKATAP